MGGVGVGTGYDDYWQIASANGVAESAQKLSDALRLSFEKLLLRLTESLNWVDDYWNEKKVFF